MTSEAAITRAVRAYLQALPETWWMKVTPNGFTSAGIPDFVVCHRGRFLAFEVKAPGNYPTPLQRSQIGKLDAAGALVGVVRSVEDVKELVARVQPLRS